MTISLPFPKSYPETAIAGGQRKASYVRHRRYAVDMMAAARRHLAGALSPYMVGYWRAALDSNREFAANLRTVRAAALANVERQS